MKKYKIIITMIILYILLGTTIVLAANSSLSINGEENVLKGESGTLKIKVTSDESIGAVNCKLNVSGDATFEAPKAINGWNLTYNEQTGKMILYKAEGITSEEIIQIDYTAANKNGTAKVTVSNIELTTINYETVKPQDVVKNITIGEQQNNDQETNNTENEIPELNIIGNEENQYMEDNQDNDNDNTIANDNIPQTGEENYILIPITAIVILSVIFYIKYIQYRANTK